MEHDICQIYLVWYLIYYIYICMDYDIYIYIIFLYGSILLILSIYNKLYIYISYTIDHFGSCNHSLILHSRNSIIGSWPQQSKRSQFSAITLPSLHLSSMKNHHKHPGIKKQINKRKTNTHQIQETTGINKIPKT